MADSSKSEEMRAAMAEHFVKMLGADAMIVLLDGDKPQRAGAATDATVLAEIPVARVEREGKVNGNELFVPIGEGCDPASPCRGVCRRRGGVRSGLGYCHGVARAGRTCHAIALGQSAVPP